MVAAQLKKLSTLLSRTLDLPWRWWWTLALVLCGTGALWWHASSYLPFFADDSFISLRYTERFLDGKGLTWTDGERVEGYSNLLWVLLCAVPGLFGANLVAGARALGVICTALAFASFVFAARPKRLRDGLVPGLAMLVLAATDTVAAWSIGGLEQPLVLALLTWGVVTSWRAVEDPDRRWAITAAACFGLLCWTRPDAPLWAVATVIGLAVASLRRAARVGALITVSVALFVGLQLAFRLAYYGDYVPNTAYAKVVITEQRLELGKAYFLESLWPLAATWLALTLGIAQGLARKATRGPALVLLASSALWTFYVVRVGGDIFPAWRHWHYLTGLAGLAFTIVAVERGPRTGAVPYGLALIALALVGGHFDPRDWAKFERWEWDGVPVARELRRAFSEQQPLFAVDASGSLPYFSKLPSLDMLGLNDRYLAHHRPKDMGKQGIGHELGDADYYLKREPDIFCFGAPPCTHAAKYAAQHEVVRKRAFTENYAPVRLQVRTGKNPMVSELWIRKNGRIGIARSPDAITIPAYFLATNPGVLGVKPKNGKTGFDARFNPNASASIERIQLAPGTWTLSALSPQGTANLRVTSRGRELASGAAPVELTLTEPSTVTLLVEAAPSGFSTHGLSLRKK